MKKVHTKHPAFTILELIFVIVVLGILASLAIPRLDRDLKQEAKDNMLSAIPYTQHLALMDDKTNQTDQNWQKQLWQIRFSTSTNNLANFYTISADKNRTNGYVCKDETAIDPVNGKYMQNLGGNSVIDSDKSPNIFIGKKYGINCMNFSGGCSGAQHISFDNLVRPYKSLGSATNNYSPHMVLDCTIQFGFTDTSITPLTVTIATETGYVSTD